jgi:hypothetical protein
LNDLIDNNCECRGSAIDENDCNDENIILGDSTLYTGKYSARNQITSLSQITQGNRVSFVGGSSIVLEPGFETSGEVFFLASIDNCLEMAMIAELSREQKQIQKREKMRQDQLNELVVYDLDNGEMMIGFYVDRPGRNQVAIYDAYNQKKFTLVDHEFMNKGLYYKRFPLSKFNDGSYQVQLQSEYKTMREKMVVGI